MTDTGGMTEHQEERIMDIGNRIAAALYAERAAALARREVSAPPAHDGYRLTAEDEQRVQEALERFYRVGAPAHELRGLFTAEAREAAVRAAAHAIGCGLVSLRECEVAYLEAAQRDAVGAAWLRWARAAGVA